VPEKTFKTIRIKWVRGGIGFSHYQKTIVRSLGLRRLNQVVVRPDTPQIRGIVAAVPHLLSIIPETVAPAWKSIPEYTVLAPEVAPPAAAEASAAPVETEVTAESAPAAEAKTPEPAAVAETKAEKAPKKSVAKKAKPAAKARKTKADKE